MKVLASLLLAMILYPGQSTAVKHYAGAVPPDVDVTVYLHTCAVCGQFYGDSVERRCITDKTFETFDGCVVAIYQRRRK